MDLHLVRAHVTALRDLSPNMRRITLSSPDFAGFPNAGPDQRVKLVIADDPADLPTASGRYGFARFTAYMIKASVRGPHIRTYTIRNHRGADHAIDIDFALHLPAGPATSWASNATIGSEVCVYGPACEFVDAHPAWQMFVGDETALPAIGAILESLPADATGKAIIEVPDASDTPDLTSPVGFELEFRYRGTTPGHQSTQLFETVANTTFPDGPVRFWVAGESKVTTGLRRYLVRERGIDKKHITFLGYWKFTPESHDKSRA